MSLPPEVESACAAMATTHCLAESDNVIGFLCTLEPNHEGAHAAKNRDGKIVAWWPNASH